MGGLDMTSVKYAWIGTILLLITILVIEGREYLRGLRERRIRRRQDQLRMVIATILMVTAVPAFAESVTGWLHPEIIDRLERFIMTVGFSVFTALWFMFRAEKRLDENNKLQTEQIALLKQLLGIKEDK